DPILRDPSLPVVSRLLELDVHYSPHLKDDPADPREEHAPASEDGDRRPVEQGPPDHLQQWKYDNNGNLAEYRDPDGPVHRYVYYSWNALHQEIDPLGHTTVFHHSSEGLVNRVEDPGGTVTEYTYDQKNRLIEVRRHGRVREQYRYDAADNLIEK